MIEEEVLLTDSEKDTLSLLAEQYHAAASEFSAAEAKKKALNSVVKATLEECGVKKFVSDSGITLSVTSKQNVSYDEEVLLRIIRDLGVDGIIKTKEYIDFDALEVALHRNQISKEDIKEGIIVKPDIVTLNCRQKKQLNE